jgi:hypothetical protein
MKPLIRMDEERPGMMQPSEEEEACTLMKKSRRKQ